jgi:hypothetical protein
MAIKVSVNLMKQLSIVLILIFSSLSVFGHPNNPCVRRRAERPIVCQILPSAAAGSGELSPASAGAGAVGTDAAGWAEAVGVASFA